MTKITYHVPTESFGYIEIEEDITDKTMLENIIERYDAFKRSETACGEGITQKEYNDALDRYLTDNTGDTDLYTRMNKDQQKVFQEIKKSLKRTQAQQARDERDLNAPEDINYDK